MRWLCLLALLTPMGCSGSAKVDGFAPTSELLTISLSDDEIASCIQQDNSDGGAPFGTPKRLIAVTMTLGAGIVHGVIGKGAATDEECLAGGLIWDNDNPNAKRKFDGDGPVFGKGDALTFFIERAPCDGDCAYEPTEASLLLDLVEP
jgi:hypothetical protein